MEGKVVAVKKKTIRVVLPSLGYMMTAEIERENVKVVKRGVF
jgi:hypothetical protein